MRRKLVLNRQPVTDLATDELAAVSGAATGPGCATIHIGVLNSRTARSG